MARAYGVLKPSMWEPGSDYRQLDVDAQWAYEMLISQATINSLGLLAYTPEKWCRLAAGMTIDRIEAAIVTLEKNVYVFVDRDAGELLVRTFIKHDSVWKQPNLVTNCRTLIRQVESDEIRQYLIDTHPWLLGDAWLAPAPVTIRNTTHDPKIARKHGCQCLRCWDLRTIETYETTIAAPHLLLPEKPLPEPLPKPLPEGVSAPRGRPRDHAPARAGAGEGVDLSTSASSTTPSPAAADAAAAEIDQHLTRLHLNGNARTIALNDPHRALAWIHLASTEARKNPAAYIRKGILSHDWPSPRLTPTDTQPNDPTEHRHRYVTTTGWQLEPDHLDHELEQLGADPDERDALLVLAGELRLAATP